MNISTKRYLALTLIAILLITGCAGQKALTTVKKPLTQKLSQYNCLKIEPFVYDAAVEIDDPVKADQLKNMLQSQTKFKIYNLSLFERVLDTESPTPGDRVVVLKGRITYMKRLTKAARVMLGAMAGRAGVAVDIQLVDPSTGSVLGEAGIQGTSSGGSVFAGGTEEAFENASLQIAEFVKNNY